MSTQKKETQATGTATDAGTKATDELSAQIETLRQENEAIRQENLSLEEKIGFYKKDMDGQCEIINAQKETIESLETAIDEKDEQINQLVRKLDTPSGSIPLVIEKAKVEDKKPAIPVEPVEHEGRQWRPKFASFYHKAVRYTAEDVAISPEILEDILSDPGQGLYVEVH